MACFWIYFLLTHFRWEAKPLVTRNTKHNLNPTFILWTSSRPFEKLSHISQLFNKCLYYPLSAPLGISNAKLTLVSKVQFKQTLRNGRWHEIIGNSRFWRTRTAVPHPHPAADDKALCDTDEFPTAPYLEITYRTVQAIRLDGTPRRHLGLIIKLWLHHKWAIESVW